VPRVYWEFCSDRVLAMEYCDGGKVDDKQYMTQHGIDVNEVWTAERKYAWLVRQILFLAIILEALLHFILSEFVTWFKYWHITVKHSF